MEYFKELSKEETIKLFKIVNDGKKARNEIVVGNIKLVYLVINTYFCELSEDRNDLFQVGCMGLINAVDNYNISNNIAFSTYATKCIYNAILQYINYNKKNWNYLSLNTLLSDNFELIDIIKCSDNEEDILDNIVLNGYICKLPLLNQKVLCLYYKEDKSVIDIAEKLKISRSYASLLIRKSILFIRKELIKSKIMDSNFYEKRLK